MSKSFSGVALPSGVWSRGYGIVFFYPEFYISINLSVTPMCTLNNILHLNASQAELLLSNQIMSHRERALFPSQKENNDHSLPFISYQKYCFFSDNFSKSPWSTASSLAVR
mmetsp:Transcript_53075/g.63962  ORF Transcript_53075/g.63962 Transcript_53075/m.63962 type:complete len:111 (-) Transcript_53075:188-520(-)